MYDPDGAEFSTGSPDINTYLAKDGYGTERKCADPINRQMECKLWESGLFSRETSVGLLNIVYFLTVNCLALEPEMRTVLYGSISSASV